FYGHFSLTAQLFPLLQAAPQARVVTVSSISHSNGRIDPSDLLQAENYDGNKAYSASKLACLIFAMELEKRARAHGTSVLSLAAHPGIARTKIGQHADNPATTLRQRAVGAAKNLAMQWLGQEADQGALPIIHAASAKDVTGGTFIGPNGFGQFKGPPALVQANAKALARHDAKRLWQMAEEFTGQHFDWD
ncbi:MAG: SDR family NAD(P)-dependent oxidoreductase, partial [Alphaproteobacteria bacterium]